MRNASPRNCASINVYDLHLQAPHDRCTRYVELWLEKRMPSSRVFAKDGTMIERSSEPEETEREEQVKGIKCPPFTRMPLPRKAFETTSWAGNRWGTVLRTTFPLYPSAGAFEHVMVRGEWSEIMSSMWWYLNNVPAAYHTVAKWKDTTTAWVSVCRFPHTYTHKSIYDGGVG